MRIVKKVLAALYLLAAIAVIGSAYMLLFSIDDERLTMFLSDGPGKMLAAVLLGILALGAVIFVIVTWAQRPEPTCIHPEGNPSIEVSADAVLSVARTTAQQHDVLVERSWARIKGRGQDAVAITLELIAFTDDGLTERARAIQQHVVRACQDMLGTPNVSVRVRFLPAKTTIVTKEA